MRKIKIVHLITSLKVGGAEKLLVDLLKNMDANDFMHYVIYFYEGPNVVNITNIPNVKIYQLKGLFCKYDPFFVLKLYLLIKKIKPDCIHSSLWSANVLGRLIAKLLKIPIISVLHLATNIEGKGNNSKFRNFVDNFIFKLPGKVVIVSESMLDDIKEYKWFKPNELVVIKNGVDIQYLNKFLLNNIKENLNVENHNFIFGTVGRFIERKNHHLLIQSFSKLVKDFENVHLVLIGYGPLENVLKNLVSELNLNGKISFVNSSQAYKYYSIFDCFVLPSNNESFGIVTLEAMFYGLPCIVTSNNLKHEIIIDGINGFIAKVNDEGDLYQKLKFCYENRQYCQNIGKMAKEHVQTNFSIEKTVKAYEQAFKDSCSKNFN